MLRNALAAALLLAPLALHAADPAPPSGEEVRKVYDYFKNGKGKGPILTGFKLCTEIDTKKGSPTSFECTTEVSGPVKKGTLLHAWVSFMVPEGDSYDDVKIAFETGGEVRQLSEVTMKESMRTRTYKSLNMSKPGKWIVTVKRDGKELGSQTLTVE